MMLDDLLALLPGLRKCRSLNADWLRVLLDRQKGECTWCGEKVPGRRLTWCSDDCVTAFSRRCSPQHAAQYVIERDGGICCLCGRDTLSAERSAKQDIAEYRRSHQVAEWHPAAMEIKAQYGFARGRFREVDHGIPVIEGGGLCDPEQLRLLCGKCHEQATSALATRRAVKR